MSLRSKSRAASPAPTAFSGISNYRTDSYRPLRDKSAPSVPTIDYRMVSKIHFDELSSYLAAYLARSPPNSRSSARQKLTRLTIQQFHELSTDVYDELVRRKKDKEVPFLPVREEFHPKRNQARQKLATLPTSRFEDLSSDVYYELSRRYPEFKEDPAGRTSSSSNYDDYPAPDFPSNSPPRATNTSRASGRTSTDRERPSDSGYGSMSGRRPSVDRRRPSIDRRRPSEDFASRRSEDDGGYAPSILSSRASTRRKASQDTTRPSFDRERELPLGRRPSAAANTSVNDISGTLSNANSSTATSDMIIPNKSTMEEEYIEVPYGRDTRDSTSTMDEQDQGRDRNGLDPDDSASDYPMSPHSPAGGLGGLSARLQGVEEDDDGPTLGRSPSAGGRFGRGEELENMQKDYEFKIATMQGQISSLQRELGESDGQSRQLQDSDARVQSLEDELAEFRQRAEQQSASMRMMEEELKELREVRQRDKDKERQRQQDADEEVSILQNRIDELEAKQAEYSTGNDPEMIEQLRSDMQGLISEVGDLSRRNDELMTAKDADLMVIRDLDAQLKDYKRKYEQAKTELRNVKATSQLYLQQPKVEKMEEQLPVSPDGGVLDIHITAFLSAIDGLLTAGRSSAPTKVLTPMKSIVNTVSLIMDDIRSFEKRAQRDRADVDPVVLKSLRERAETTLSNLVVATKTHAMSSGLSPVSLLDAAASHVSVTITEIGKTVCIRKASSAEQDQFNNSAGTYTPSVPATNGFSPALRSIDELGSHSRKGSQASPSAGRFGELRRRLPAEDSGSEKTNSPPPIFDHSTHGGPNSDDSTALEDNWAELKPYLEAQTESIVYAIQSVLSGVRSPTPSPTISENITQIITIVSSIVAVCKDNLPPAHAQQGSEILRELSEHATKLSDVQSLPEITKESRQVMAKSSFAIANAMKGLMKL